jgi:predicted secreted protein
MKLKIALICILALGLIGFAACSSLPNHPSVIHDSCAEFSENANITETVDVGVYGTVTLILCSNASTGYSWPETAHISNTNVLEQTGYHFEEPGGDLVGAPGRQVWAFTALAVGESTVTLDYSRPWEGEEESLCTFTLTVNVE